MKDIFNKFLDILSYIFSKLSYVIIIAVLGLFVFSKLNNLFDVGIIDKENFISKKLNLNSQEEVVDLSPAKIIYKGGRPSEEQIQAEEDFLKSKGSIVSFEIQPNQSIDEICQNILAAGLIEDSSAFKKMLESTKLIDKIEPGTYEVPADIINRDLISEITHTEVVNENISSKNVEKEETIDLVSFELKEEDGPIEVSNTLKEAGLIQDTTTFINLLEDANLLDEIKPGKYRLPKNIKNIDLIESITLNDH